MAPTIDLDTPGYAVPSESWATADDARNALGNLRDRLPAWVDVDEFVRIAHASAVDLLSSTYPEGIPTFAGNGLSVVRYAEAKIAAAEILEAIRINLPDLGDAPDRLRESALSSLNGGVVGYPAGSTDVDDDGDPDTPPAQTAGVGPRMSSSTPLSAFPDPYEAGRLDPYGDRHIVADLIRFQ